ncbi:hypothetical protein SAMN05216388_10066 [Halorientalis persicus]|uniref:C2H2-type domain-containing protein n=1 Tax=Halorientalis persicus TaxID=1367881 RepID=A0A1H8KB91_9EURY|nr:hypothetical protein [Halorientalis persicus]SEN90233.1 hypothetical protein SAMN05216388_10066 [Halorientalis persicus]
MECPTCGKSLTTERGVKQHHTKVHDDPLPNRECAGCGTEFYDPKARLTYCDDCNPNAGEHNGNWKDAKEKTECERCGDEFEYYPSDKKGVYCPTCVEEADEFLGTHYAEVHDIEPVSRECKQCGEQFEVLPCFTRDGDRKFCDHDCLSSWLSDEWGAGLRCTMATGARFGDERLSGTITNVASVVKTVTRWAVILTFITSGQFGISTTHRMPTLWTT